MNTLETFQALVHDVTGIDPAQVTPEKSLREDLGIDSLSFVEIVYACEDHFGIAIPDQDSKGLTTVGQVVSYIDDAN